MGATARVPPGCRSPRADRRPHRDDRGESMVDVELVAVSRWTLSAGAATAAGALFGAGLLVAARVREQTGLLLRFLAMLGLAWAALSAAYFVSPPGVSFQTYLVTSRVPTVILAAAGAVYYVAGLARFQPADRQWRRSAAILAGIALLGGAFVRAAQDPATAPYVQAPLSILMLATVWRLQAEPLVYLAMLAGAYTVVQAGPAHLFTDPSVPATLRTTTVAAAVSAAMILLGGPLGFVPRQEANVRWYRQGLLIVPLLVATLAAAAAGYSAVWYGTTWHTVWALGVWWAVLLVAAIGLKQPDLFGFSSVAAGMAAVATFAALGGPRVEGYWGRYPSVLVALAFGAAVLAALLAAGRKRTLLAAFARALYLAAVAVAVAAIVIEPLDTESRYVGADLLIATAVLALAHAHRAPAWVNFLVAGGATAGVAAVAWPGLGAEAALWHERIRQVAAAAAVGWLLAAIALREILRHTAADRTARRQTEPLTLVGLVATVGLAVYLMVLEVGAYAELMIDGASPTRDLLGPVSGLVSWVAVLVALLLSMWLVRHTARTFLFYLAGISATVYLGLLRPAVSPEDFLIYAVAGYGSAHLLVYLYERKFMELLSRGCALYRDERRASTTIFTLAVISCFVAAVMAAFRLWSPASLLMLAIMAAVFLVWSFVWLRGEMLYLAVLMVTLCTLSMWHTVERPEVWTPWRIEVNAALLTFSAVLWLVIGVRIHGVRGEVFQLAGPARACSVILALVGTGFTIALALSPALPGEVWRAGRTTGEWALGLSTLSALIFYYAWAAHVFRHRFYHAMSGLAVLAVGLYVGLYAGMRL